MLLLWTVLIKGVQRLRLVHLDSIEIIQEDHVFLMTPQHIFDLLFLVLLLIQGIIQVRFTQADSVEQDIGG